MGLDLRTLILNYTFSEQKIIDRVETPKNELNALDVRLQQVVNNMPKALHNPPTLTLSSNRFVQYGCLIDVNKILIHSPTQISAISDQGLQAPVYLRGTWPRLPSQEALNNFLTCAYLVVTQRNDNAYQLMINIRGHGGGNNSGKTASRGDRDEGLRSYYDLSRMITLFAAGECDEEALRKDIRRNKEEFGHINHSIMNVQIKLKYTTRLDRFRPLQFAISGGYVELARILLEEGADPNVFSDIIDHDKYDVSVPLVIAGQREDKKMVSLLLDHGADLRMKQVQVAVIKNSTLRVFLNECARQRQTSENKKSVKEEKPAEIRGDLKALYTTPDSRPLKAAIHRKDKMLIQQILNNKVNIPEDAISLVIKQGDQRIIDLIFGHCLQKRDFPGVVKFLKEGCHPSRGVWSAANIDTDEQLIKILQEQNLRRELFKAAIASEKLPLVKQLLAEGERISNKDLEDIIFDGLTKILAYLLEFKPALNPSFLVLAVDSRRQEVVIQLLTAGIQCGDQGGILLKRAAEMGWCNVIVLLTRAGAGVTSSDSVKDNPLHCLFNYAKSHSTANVTVESIFALVARGADVMQLPREMRKSYMKPLQQALLQTEYVEFHRNLLTPFIKKVLSYLPDNIVKRVHSIQKMDELESILMRAFIQCDLIFDAFERDDGSIMIRDEIRQALVDRLSSILDKSYYVNVEQGIFNTIDIASEVEEALKLVVVRHQKEQNVRLLREREISLGEYDLQQRQKQAEEEAERSRAFAQFHVAAAREQARRDKQLLEATQAAAYEASKAAEELSYRNVYGK